MWRMRIGRNLWRRQGWRGQGRSPAPVKCFGVLEKGVKGRHPGDRKAVGAIEKTPLQQVRSDKRPRRVEDQPSHGYRPVSGDQFLCCQRRVAIERTHMLGERLTGEVQKVAAELSRGAVDTNAFVD